MLLFSTHSTDITGLMLNYFDLMLVFHVSQLLFLIYILGLLMHKHTLSESQTSQQQGSSVCHYGVEIYPHNLAQNEGMYVV